ncbi:hypothetical protein [Nostoc sp.]
MAIIIKWALGIGHLSFVIGHWLFSLSPSSSQLLTPVQTRGTSRLYS